MATTKPQKASKPAAAPASVQSRVKTPSQTQNMPFLFDKQNYMIMIAGVAVIIIGFMLMTGPANDDPNVFNKEEIYSFRRITLAPVVVIIGFVIEVFAIMRKPAAATTA
jgi:hypothetical protein